ncbi:MULTISPECIES: hypothetical protein [Flavobacterium]|uniref:hypothetical protein n=1 Tax=Flavobacterium TaxID=237 RepID=UPI0015A96699|nr:MULTISPECIES: hypothetical protein [Flavobacterium]MBN9283331.1 hypothetical protein [Flavobacterium sp.]
MKTQSTGSGLEFTKSDAIELNNLETLHENGRNTIVVETCTGCVCISVTRIVLFEGL